MINDQAHDDQHVVLLFGAQLHEAVIHVLLIAQLLQHGLHDLAHLVRSTDHDLRANITERSAHAKQQGTLYSCKQQRNSQL